MRSSKRLLIVVLALILLASSLGAGSPAPTAWSCASYHTVRYGQTLSGIGAYYGVYWPYLAQVNQIPAPYHIYAGTVLCIPAGGYYNTGYNNGGTGGYPPYYYGYGRTWSFNITGVQQDVSVAIQSYNFPSDVVFKVQMGKYNAGAYQWTSLPDLDTGAGGNAGISFNIPASLAGTPQLVLRLTQAKKNGNTFFQDQAFYNGPGGGTGGYPPPTYYPPNYYYGVPTIWIVSVQPNTSVTIQTRNFPPGINFEVLMGPMGSYGHGYVVGNLYSNGGGTLVATFPIPAQLQGLAQISIRTQNYPTGYYSYNWFWNTAAY